MFIVIQSYIIKSDVHSDTTDTKSYLCLSIFENHKIDHETRSIYSQAHNSTQNVTPNDIIQQPNKPKIHFMTPTYQTRGKINSDYERPT